MVLYCAKRRANYLEVSKAFFMGVRQGKGGGEVP